jgi:transposase InsO family protein
MGIVQSMSRSGNCWDNACIESFFGHMKDELGIRKNGKGELMGYSNMKKVIADWVREYNTVRPHSVLDGMSPIGYRTKMLYHTKECLQ